MDLSQSILRRFALGAIPTFAATVILAFAAQATTIHVPGDAPTIQAGVDLAAFGDTVEVACGTYPAGAILKDGIVVRSETGLPDCVLVDVVSGTSAFRAVNLPQGVLVSGFRLTSPLTEVRGMIVSASVIAVRDCEFLGLGPGIDCMAGAGLWLGTSNATLERCLFEDNDTGFCTDIQDTQGGGIYCISSTLTMRDCTMRRNKATDEGGAMFLENSSVTLLDCHFVENEVVPAKSGAPFGGAILWHGGLSPLTVSGCTFEANYGGYAGGCIYTFGGPATIINNSRFENNHAGSGSALYTNFGGVFEIGNSSFKENDPEVINGIVHIDNTLFARNFGQCIRAEGPSSIEGSTFVQNNAASGSVINPRGYAFTVKNTIIAFSEMMVPIGCSPGMPVTVECSDFFGNGGGDWVGCLAGQDSMNGNLSANPFFCDIAHDDFTLQANSPCAPPQSGACGQIGAFGVGCEPVHVEAKSWGGIKALYR